MLNTISLAIATVGMADGLKPGDHTRSVDVGGGTRTYIAHVPSTYDGTAPTPVVLAFHGGGSNARAMPQFTGLSRKADKAGFVVVYPNGTGRLARVLTWNAGNCCGYAMRNNIDDVAFVRALLDDLAKVVRVDPKRVYATGMSNGAMISYRLASELSDRIAAIAPIGATMGAKTCRPARPVPVMHFHGAADRFAPYDGGRGRGPSGTEFYSVEHTIRAWVKANGCPETPKIDDLPDKADDGMRVVRHTYGPGTAGAEVVLVIIEGGGHTWPGRDPRLRWLGPSTRDISANDLMWEFFEKHPMK